MAPITRKSATSSSRATAGAFSPVDFLRDLLTSPRYFWKFASLILLGELLLGILIIRFVPYTEIDYKAYMEQVDGFLGGERDYSQLKGGTGPLVYPALHLYIYTALSYLPSISPKILETLSLPARLDTHLLPQLVFLGLYLFQFVVAASVYAEAGLPQYTLVLLALGKRAHSVYMLRLFGDCWAVAVVWVAIALFMQGWWTVGSVIFSIALGIKMNVLLYVPGLLLLQYKAIGPVKMVLNVALMAFVQVLLPAPFFLSPDPLPYLTSAFDFSRSFLYKWTVNWRFLTPEVFNSRAFHYALLVGHVEVLLAFAFVWCRSEEGGVFGVFERGLLKGRGIERRMWKREVPTILFTSNLIGMLFARSLHYQFQAWYFHQIPFLLYLTPYPFAVSSIIFLLIEHAWSTYPSTIFSSLSLLVAHITLLVGLWSGDAEGREGGGVIGLDTARAVSALRMLSAEKEEMQADERKKQD